MSFITPEQIDAILARLKAKARRQEAALDQTEAQIEHWQHELDFELTPKGEQERKGAPPKKGAPKD